MSNASPQGNEPLQNQVIQPAGNPQPHQPQPPQQQLQMNPAERIGVNNLVNEFRRSYDANFAPLNAELQNPQNLEAAMYWICHEVDTLQRHGHNIAYILGADNLMTRIASAAAMSLRGNIPFQNMPFMTQLFFMNITIFALRYLNR